MNTKLIRYWFEFEIQNVFEFPPGIGIGCGVTAFDVDDAIQIMDKNIFPQARRPLIVIQIENIDISKLDQQHVIPNVANVTKRGIWFPLGYE